MTHQTNNPSHIAPNRFIGLFYSQDAEEISNTSGVFGIAPLTSYSPDTSQSDRVSLDVSHLAPKLFYKTLPCPIFILGRKE